MFFSWCFPFNHLPRSSKTMSPFLCFYFPMYIKREVVNTVPPQKKKLSQPGLHRLLFPLMKQEALPSPLMLSKAFLAALAALKRFEPACAVGSAGQDSLGRFLKRVFKGWWWVKSMEQHNDWVEKLFSSCILVGHSTSWKTIRKKVMTCRFISIVWPFVTFDGWGWVRLFSICRFFQEKLIPRFHPT